MGEALLSGLINAGWARPDELAVVELLPARRDELNQKYTNLPVGDVPEKGVDVVLAVKPNDVGSAMESLQGKDIERILTIAAGVKTSTLEKLAGESAEASAETSAQTSVARIVRAMPNTPALLGMGASAIAGGTAAEEADMQWAQEILSCVGKVIRIEENLLDAVTGLSGSGPAYLFYLAEALTQAGIEAGLDLETSDLLVRQTLLGSAHMLADGEDSASQLRAKVTSPNGTTERAIQFLNSQGAGAAFIEAVQKATERATEISEEI